MSQDNQNRNNRNNQNNQNNNQGRNFNLIMMLLVAFAAALALQIFMPDLGGQSAQEVTYGEFRQMVKAGLVESVEMTSSKYTFKLKSDLDFEQLLTDAQANADESEDFVGDDAEEGLPSLKEFISLTQSTKITLAESQIYYCAPIGGDTGLISLLEEQGITDYGPKYEQAMSPLLSMLLELVLLFGGMLLMFYLISRVMGKSMGSGGGMGGFNPGKSTAKVYMEKETGVTFADVAGQDEAKESLEEIIDFLHNPQRYTEIGAKLPKGALLVGAPGTGKTLLAKAVAGEAKVPFFSISGSDFVEMYVGVGASRVRDLFKEAAKVAPCIIFIDEIDTIGRSREGQYGGGGESEREQTLNQLLAELDGFDPTKGVIVLAATNRPEVLDKALLRPGRFDRRIIVDRPNLAGRLATLKVHTKNIRLAEDVDLNRIAQATAGCVGADLANLVNEAALRAVRFGRKTVNQEDLLRSFEVVIAGTEKKGTVLVEEEKKLIAYHEVGHALVSAKQKEEMPVTKITIVPHTAGTLGFTMHLPEEEKFLHTDTEILSRIRTLLGGRAAEELVFSTKTSGASNDIERATELARNFIATFGMSERFGAVGFTYQQNQFLGGGHSLNCAQETAAAIDQEIMNIITVCAKEARDILEANRKDLDSVAAYLLQKETITGEEMMAILHGENPEEAESMLPTTRDLPPASPPSREITE